MALKPIVGEIKSQPLNDNFSYLESKLSEESDLEQRVDDLDSELTSHKAERATSTKLGHVYGFRGALIKPNVTQSIPHNTFVNLDFDHPIYDTNSFFNVNFPKRLTIPNGVSKVRMLFQVRWSQNSEGSRRITLRKNGSAFVERPMDTRGSAENEDTRQFIVSPVLFVNSGDYFEFEVRQTSGGSLDVIYTNETWAAIEVIE